MERDEEKTKEFRSEDKDSQGIETLKKNKYRYFIK